MKLPDFDRSKQWWDDHKAFHIDHQHNITQFDTGEVIYTTEAPLVGTRDHTYNEVATILTTVEGPSRKLTDPITGKDVPNSWLTLPSGDGQFLLLDYGTGRAVRLQKYRNASSWHVREGIPARFHNHRCCAYFPGNGMPPMGAPVELSMTVPLTKDERAHVTTLADASRAWLEIKNWTRQQIIGAYPTGQSYDVTNAWLKQRRMALPLDPANVITASFDDLDAELRFRLANHGVTPRKEQITRAYLTF